MKDKTAAGALTRAEIFQQPDTWRDTMQRLRRAPHSIRLPAIVTGAGSSFFAALAVEAAWEGVRAVASTDLLAGFETHLRDRATLVSIARSGDSPESAALVSKVRGAFPEVGHLAITCNAAGRLAHADGVESLILDPRTNDRALAMTSSFSNLALAGILLGRASRWAEEIDAAAGAVAANLGALEAAAARTADAIRDRVVFLASPAMRGAALEASLKILEMTAGDVVPLAETYLGLRHGPMSFLKPGTPAVCFVSTCRKCRAYELDLAADLRAKGFGPLIGVGPPDVPAGCFDVLVPSPAARLPDWLRTPFDIVFAQLLAYRTSLKLGYDPDHPSPNGVISRVVPGFRVYDG